MIDYRPEELLIDVLAGMLDGPGSRRGRRRLADSGRRGFAGARALGRPPARLGPGQRAAQPVHRRRRRAVRLRRAGADRRLLPGRRQIDGQANINLVGVGGYPQSQVRWPGSFGSAYLYFLVPRVILFREEHTRRVLVPKVEFVSAPGSARERVPPGRPARPGDRVAACSASIGSAAGSGCTACIRGTRSTRSWAIPGSTSMCRRRCPRRPRRRRRRSH